MANLDLEVAKLNKVKTNTARRDIERKNLDDVFLKNTLSGVSRTFAINIRYLGKEQRRAIAVAYLICRALDCVEDDPKLSDGKKIDLLLRLKTIIQEASQTKAVTKAPTKAFSHCIRENTSQENISPKNIIREAGKWVRSAKLKPPLPAEAKLIKDLERVFSIYCSLPPFYRSAIATAAIAMASGMAVILNRYKNQRIKHLGTLVELEEYCYYVAGTVGVMLTTIFIQSTPPYFPEKKKYKLRQYTLSFAYTLQMTNILKDFRSDGDRGWLYIPKSILNPALTKQSLSVADFLRGNSPKIDKVTRTVRRKLISHLEPHLKKACAYATSLSVWQIRQKIFCLIALNLALATIAVLNNDKTTANSPSNPKLTRKTVKRIVFFSIIFTPFNFLLKKTFKILYKNT